MLSSVQSGRYFNITLKFQQIDLSINITDCTIFVFSMTCKICNFLDSGVSQEFRNILVLQLF